MRRWLFRISRIALAALASSSLGCAGAAAGGPSRTSVPRLTSPGETEQVAGFVRELRALEITLPTGARVTLEALITRPAAPVAYPLILLSHGTFRGGDEPNRRMTPADFSSQALALARRGYGVAVVLRRGYGRSDGPRMDDAGPCEESDYDRVASAEAEDILGSLRVLVREPWVDPSRVVLLGLSAGGLGSLATAAVHGKGIRGVISFAGGTGSTAPGVVCQTDRLVATMAALGRRSRVPSLWIYAENDHFFAPPLARRMADAYAAGGAPVQLAMAPPFGEDGHELFPTGPTERWWPLIEGFLARVGLPSVPPKVPSNASPALATPPNIDPRAFADYLASDGFEKAFAAGVSGWGSAVEMRTATEAIRVALEFCRKNTRGCRLYAVGNDYAR